MTNIIKKIDFVFTVLEKYNDSDFEKISKFISRLFKFENIGKIFIYTTNGNNFNLDNVIINVFERHDTGDALLSILRNRSISNDFILCTELNDFTDEVLTYIMNNPNTIPLIYKENPKHTIKLDEFNRIQSIGFSVLDGFGYEDIGLFRMNKITTLTLVQAYHLEFYNKESNIYMTSNSKGFNILDLFNHTNWGLFTFDIFNIGEES